MKYLFFISIILLSFSVKAQQRFPTGFPTQFNAGWNKWGYAMSDSGTIIANRDTNWLAKYSGTVVFRPANKKFYYFDSTTLLWNQFGTVIDTISLSNRINLKLNISDTATMLTPYLRKVDTAGIWITNVYRKAASDSVFYVKGGVSVFAFRDSIGAGGTGLTSVGLSMPSAFSVTNSPLTVNGTISVSGAGTTLQYIRGNGTLATTDTGMIPNFYLKVRGLLSGTSPITFNQTTGLIGINNANVSGTKGAASFNSASFSDNGSGLISLTTPVTAGSCTNCSITFGADGRATVYGTGTGPTGVSVDTLWRTPGVDSIYFTINSTQYAIKDSSGSNGTVINVSGTANRITVTNPTTTPVIDIAATYVGQTSITTLGTIATGVWNGTAIGATFGGTGQTTVTTGDLLFGNAPNTWGKLAGVATGNALISGGVTTAPLWGKIGLTTHVFGILPIANGGTGTTTPSLIAGTDISITGTWPNQTINATGGGGTALVSDLGRLPQIKVYMPAFGTNASAVFSASYPAASIDSAYYAFTASGVGTENGGWLAAGTSGDSVQVTAPFGIVFGNSIMEGHPGRHGRLHPLVSGVAQNTFIYNYPDSIGQISYHLRGLTNMRWYNHGIGGQTTVDMRKRFMRDVAADSVPGMTDGRGNQTLKQRPQIVIIEGGINDIFNGVDATVTKANLEWMAATCQERNIRCIILNIPGDAASNQSQLRLIASMNEWLKSGVMDQYNACLVDFNLWWNDPDYGGDNIHPTSLIVDDIHPTMVGYDSLANYIFRSAKLPVLTRAIFINELDPAGFTGYSRPANITINGGAYSLSTATDSVDITSFVPDSVWIKVISSTNVTGTTYTGFSHILWKLDNNVLDSVLFTRRTFYNNSVSYPSLSGVDIIAAKPSNNLLAFRIRMNDLNETFRVLTSGGGGAFIFNGLANTTSLNSATVSIYNAGANAIGTNGNIKASGTTHQFGVLELNQNATAGTTGFGISAANSASSLSFIGTASAGMDLVRITTWNGASSNLSTNPTNLLNITGAGFGNSTAINQVGHAISLVPTINNTVGDAGSEVTGIYYNPIRTSLTNTRHVGIFMRSGNNYFNVAGTDSTCFGCDSASNILAKYRVNGSFRLDNVTAPPSTYTVLVHGLTDSIVYQVPSSTFGGIATLNALTAGTQTFAVGTSGSDFNISSATSTHTFNIPSASTSNRGLITASSQVLGGEKTFTNGIVANSVGQGVGVLISGDRTAAAAPGVGGIGIQIAAFTYTNTSGAGTVSANQNMHLVNQPTLTSSNAIPYTGDVATIRFAGAPIAGGSTTIDHPYNIFANDNSYFQGLAGGLNETASDITLGAGMIQHYTGTGGTWTLPSLASAPGRFYYVKNMGSGNLTVQRGGSDNIFDASSVTSVILAVGDARIFIGGGSFWAVH